MFTVIASQARLSFPFCLLFLPFLSRNKAARGLTGFINGAATPPNLGGEFSRLPIHSHLRGGRSMLRSHLIDAGEALLFIRFASRASIRSFATLIDHPAARSLTNY